jgi:hypothetical protein
MQSLQPVWMHGADARCRAVAGFSLQVAREFEVEDLDDMVEVEDSHDTDGEREALLGTPGG